MRPLKGTKDAIHLPRTTYPDQSVAHISTHDPQTLPVQNRAMPSVSLKRFAWAFCRIWINEQLKLCQPRTLVRGERVFKPA